jgi:hypothetical protein
MELQHDVKALVVNAQLSLRWPWRLLWWQGLNLNLPGELLPAAALLSGAV